MSKRNFVRGAAVLAAAGIVVKILGAFFRIPLANVIGDVGMGYYNTVYPIYATLVVIASAGIPSAISRMVSEREEVENYHGAYRVFKVAFALLITIGVVTSLGLAIGAKYIINGMKDPGVYYPMLFIAPALFFVSIMASFRGYFQGTHNMKPTAVSQVLEQFIRVLVGLFLAILLFRVGAHIFEKSSFGITLANLDNINWNASFGAAGASFGATAGGLVGATYLVFKFLKNKKNITKKIENSLIRDSESKKSILKTIVFIAAPITLGAMIMPLMYTIDAIIVKNILQHRMLVGPGFSYDEANALFGQLSGLTEPLINLPQVVSLGIAISIVPVISAARVAKDKLALNKNISLGLRLTMAMAIPAGIGLMVMAYPLMYLFFSGMGEAVVSNASECLVILAFGGIFLCMSQFLTGTLQGLAKQGTPVKNLLIGVGVKIVFTIFLTSIIDIKGAAIGTAIAYLIAATLNYRAVTKHTKVKIKKFETFGKPFVAALFMGIVAYLTYYLGNLLWESKVITIVAIVMGAVAYFVAMLLIKGVTEEELAIVPRAGKLVKLLKKLKLL